MKINAKTSLRRVSLFNRIFPDVKRVARSLISSLSVLVVFLCLFSLLSPTLSHAGRSAATTTTLSTSPITSAINENVTLTATVASAAATGSVTFKDGTMSIGTGTLYGGVATLVKAFTSSGSHSITAVYGGAAGYATSTSAPKIQTVTTTVLPATTTTVASSRNPAGTNQSVVLNSVVSPATATGTVTFKDGTSTIGTATVNSGTANLPYNFSTVATHSLTATYNGSTAFAGSTSTALSQTVTLPVATLTLSSEGSANGYAHRNFVLFARMTDYPATPTGTITFYNGATNLGSATVGYGYSGYPWYYARLPVDFDAGDKTVTATYNGNANLLPVTSNSYLVKNYPQTATTITLTEPQPTTAYANQLTSLSASILPATSLNTGSVTFYEGATAIGTAPTSASLAQKSISFATAGTHTVSASYNGFNTSTASSSTTTSVSVNVLPQYVTTTTIGATANPASVNQSFNLTANVMGSGPIPTGIVTFKDGAITLGAANLVAGNANYSVSFPTTGSHIFTAVYGGDTPNAISTSVALPLTINTKSISTVSLTATPNPVSVNGTLILSAIATAGTTGTITFKDSEATLGTATLVEGRATVTTSLASAGLHYVSASYAGNKTFNPAISLPVTVQVGSGVGLTSPGNMTWLYGYDTKGNLTSIKNPNGNVTALTNDRLERNVAITLPAAGAGNSTPVINKLFDGRDQLVSVLDPRSLTTLYAVDGLGNEPRSLTSPDTGVSLTTVDANSNVISKTNAKGKTTNITYDDENRPVSISYQTGVPTVIEYDGGTNPAPYSSGHMTRITDESGVTSFTYDILGRVVSKMVQTGGKTFQLTYTWGTSGFATGKLTSMTYPSGSIVNYSYNTAGRLSGVVVNPVNANGVGTNINSNLPVLSDVTYNAFSSPIGWVWSDGSVNQRTYDSFGRLSSYLLGKPSATGISAGLSRTISYDNAGLITGYTHTNSSGAQAGFNQSFAYDGLSRIFSSLVVATWYGYDYDNTGNRTDRLIGGTNYLSTVSATSNRLDQVQSPGPVTNTYSYDAAGNVINDGTVIYAYSDRGRLATATIGSNVVSYKYNGLEHRVSKTGPTQVVPTGGAYYIYNEAGQLIGEYDASGSPIYETIYTGSLPVSVMKQAGSAASSTLAVNLYNVYSDHIDTPRVITRQSDQAIVWRWDSTEPYGSIAPNQNPNALGVFTYNQRHPGQVFDAETGNFQNWHREYNPRIGRYIQSDPIGLAGGINTYEYVAGNPLSFVDLDGLQGAPLRPNFRSPPLPYRVEQHNAEMDPNRQVQRQFQDDPFAPILGIPNNTPWCREVCDPANACSAPPSNSMVTGEGCYRVCTQGPFLSDPKSPPLVPTETMSRRPGRGDIFGLYRILRGR